MSVEVQVTNIVNEILKVESIEEAFSCFLVQRPELASEKLNTFLQELQVAFSGNPTDQENAVKQYLLLAASMSNPSRLHVLFTLLENLVSNNTLPARLVCDCILSCDKLVYQNECFWCESFHLIKRILPGVNYKGVREIMKNCFEKLQTLPVNLNAAVVNQTKVTESVIENIFDRNNCLLPAYFIITELQKAYPEGKKWPHWFMVFLWPHWKLAKLFSNFVESFRPVAQMVSIVNHSKMLPVIEHSGFADHLVHPWKLDPITLRLSLKGSLPYEKSLLEPQTHLLRYVLEQPYSRDMVCTMLGLQKQLKQRCGAIEEQFVELVMVAMEKTEAETSTLSEENLSTHWLWLHLSCQLIYFVLFHFINFTTVVNSLHEKLSNRDLRKGRDHLMWVLLQFISGSIQRNPLANFLPVLNLFDLLYPEREPIPVPDFSKPECTHQIAVTCIWLQLLRKAQIDHHNIQRPIPHALKAHQEFLQMISSQNLCMAERDYRLALLCNAYSTNQEYFSRPMAALVESILGTGKGGPGGISSAPTTPLSMSVLDSLTIHSKMSLIHSIVTHVIKMAASKSNMALAPALVETYSRLLVYTEIESIGIKGFISSLLPSVFKSHAWVILYTLLEMFSYRMHHTQPHYRVQLVSHLHSLAAVPQTNQTQLHLCVESTALRLITGLGSGEVQSQLSKFLNEPKTIVSAESEELNRALVLTLARSMHITGTGTDLGSNWCKELLNTIMQSTPHSWANHTLQFFPPALSEFFQQNPLPMENKQQLKKAVDEEYRNWASMNNENDIIAHFSVQTLPLFLCLLWKMILETDRISPIAYKILERIGARALSAHLRKFCDYLVFEIASSEESHHVNKCVDAINNMIWKYNIVTIDRLVLCMALRTLEGNEAQVCFFIIQLLLIKAAELRNRVSEFVKENSPQHWKQSNWHEKHLAFHRKYPEKCAPEEQGGGSYSNYHSLPVYFGNVCLRFLPVFDIVIHRCLELPPVTKSLENLLEHLGSLYKFHDRPVTYLYNTLHYYERKLRDRPPLKRKLVSAILGNLSDNMRVFSLSDPYTKYMQSESDKWVPELDYYINLIQRIVDSMSGTAQFPPTDWRFNEFPNPAAHALYITCVELMALPVQPNVVGNNLLDVISKGYSMIRANEIEMWINSVGLVAAALPESYRSVLNDRLVALVTELGETGLPPRCDPFSILNFQHVHNSLLENKYAFTLATAHAVWHHAGSGQISTVPQFVKNKLSPLVQTEEQLVLLCHLFGPFLQRFNVDRSKCVMDLTLELYTVLEQVDKAMSELKYMDPICDLLYHIKYMFIGDTMKSEAELIIRRLRPALQKRLRFIAHLSIEEIENRDGSVPALAQSSVQPTNVVQSPQVV